MCVCVLVRSDTFLLAIISLVRFIKRTVVSDRTSDKINIIVFFVCVCV